MRLAIRYTSALVCGALIVGTYLEAGLLWALLASLAAAIVHSIVGDLTEP